MTEFRIGFGFENLAIAGLLGSNPIRTSSTKKIPFGENVFNNEEEKYISSTLTTLPILRKTNILIEISKL